MSKLRRTQNKTRQNKQPKQNQTEDHIILFFMGFSWFLTTHKHNHSHSYSLSLLQSIPIFRIRRADLFLTALCEYLQCVLHILCHEQ